MAKYLWQSMTRISKIPIFVHGQQNTSKERERTFQNTFFYIYTWLSILSLKKSQKKTKHSDEAPANSLLLHLSMD